MSLKFNPLSGQLDFAKATIYEKEQIIVDAAFLASPVKTLSAIPDLNSEMVFLNGLHTCDTEYVIVNDEFTWLESSDLRVGDIIDIRFNT